MLLVHIPSSYHYVALIVIVTRSIIITVTLPEQLIWQQKVNKIEQSLQKLLRSQFSS